MDGQAPNPQLTVDEILNHWPITADVFASFKTACVGCYLARFCTLADVADTYHLAAGELIRKLIEAKANLHIITIGENHEATTF